MSIDIDDDSEDYFNIEDILPELDIVEYPEDECEIDSGMLKN